MSTIRKIPFIESVLSGLSKGLLNNLKTILDSNESNVELGFGNLPTINTITPTNFKLDVNNKKSGILIYTSDICVLIAYHRFQDLQLFKLNVSNSTYEKINEYCDINELRRVLDDTVESTGAIDSGDADANTVPVADGEGGVQWKDASNAIKGSNVEEGNAIYLLGVDSNGDVIKDELPEGIVVDESLDAASTNAVANKPVAEAINSLNTAVATKFNKSDIDTSLANPTSDEKIVSEKAIVNELDKKANQTKVDALETSIGQIQEQIAGSNIEIPEEKTAYQTVIPETLEYNDLIYKRNGKITTAILSKLGGLTKKYNQLSDTTTRAEETANGITFSITNGVISMSGTATGGLYRTFDNVDLVSNHKYFIANYHLMLYATIGGTNYALGQDNHNDYAIVTCSMSGTYNYQTDIRSGATVNKNIALCVVGLTEIYGTGNEPTTVDQFLTDYPIFRGYVPYTTGTLDYAYAKKVDIKGFNIWNEETKNGYFYTDTGIFVANANRLANNSPIKVTPNTTYYLNKYSDGFAILQYDNNMNYLGIWSTSATFTTNVNCYYINFCTLDNSTYGNVYNHDICINVSNTTLNGTYKPYYNNELLEAKIVAIKQKLVGLGYSEYVLGYGLDNAYNYIDLENKKVVLKMGGVDLGSLSWIYEYGFFRADLNTAKMQEGYITPANILCSKYTTDVWSNTGDASYDKIIAISYASQTVGVNDSDYTDTTTFKTAMSGVPLIYELATPVEIDVSDILDNDDVIGLLESGGTITFDNDDMYPVISNIKYYCYNVEESIIEGDSDSNTTGTNITLSDEYIHYQQTAGALMFVVAGKFTIADTINAGDVMLTSLFTIDEAAGQYIYPIEDENVDFNIVDCSKDVIVNPTTLTTNADTVSVLGKGSNTSIRYRMVANENINAGSYVFRFAITLKL